MRIKTKSYNPKLVRKVDIPKDNEKTRLWAYTRKKQMSKKEIKKVEKIIVFGVGKRLEDLLENGCMAQFEVVAFCDSDVKKQGMIIGGIRVIPPNEIDKFKFDTIYISTEKYFDEIKQKLVNNFKINPQNIKQFTLGKWDSELMYWRKKYKEEGHRFRNKHYKELMLNIAQETSDMFLDGKIVADFGCGPRGSLAWTDKPIIKLGIDVLTGKYLENFGDELIKHGMVYVTSSEERIPIPDAFVDCLFTINSLDHVANLEKMIFEILRIMKPGGILFASFNLNEPPTVCEPQNMTEEMIRTKILKDFEIQSYRMAYKGTTSAYLNMVNNSLVDSLENNKAGILWVRGQKK